MTGLNSKNRWTTRSISKISNRLIELATPRIFDLNQKLLNYAINKIIVPRINAILTMFSVIVPSTTTPPSTTNDVKSKKKKKKKPISHDSTQQKLRKDDTVYFRELDDNTIIKYLRENPIQLPDDDDKVISMLFNEKYYDSKRKIIFQWSHIARFFKIVKNYLMFYDYCEKNCNCLWISKSGIVDYIRDLIRVC